MQKQYLRFGERVKIYDFIKTIGHIEDGFWVYDEGWNDAQVSKKMGYTVGNITGVRSELGKLKHAAPLIVAMHKLEARVLDLEHHNRELMSAFESVAAKIKELDAKMSKLALREHFKA